LPTELGSNQKLLSIIIIKGLEVDAGSEGTIYVRIHSTPA